MANRIKHKRNRYARRKMSVRKGVSGTSSRPRMTVFRSARHIYVQVVNDLEGKTLVSSSTMCKDLKASVKQGGNVEAAKAVGVDIAEKAKAAGIEAVVFDRNGFRYHGRLQALADAAREKGLKF
ncbi:MAG: 50S ribosomal protein L18 [Planctomycetota bacterium]